MEHQRTLLLRGLFAAMDPAGHLFGYSGRFPDEHSARLIELGEVVAERHVAQRNGKARLGYIFVEAYQNIFRHRAVAGADAPTSGERSVFMFLDHCGEQVLITRNAVTGNQAAMLNDRLTALLAMDPAALKELNKVGIQRPSTPGVRGAGLGLIGMLRRTGTKPRWNFTPTSSGQQLFTLQWYLDQQAAPGDRPAEAATDVYTWMALNAVHFVHAGAWSENIGRLLRRLLETEWPAAAPAGRHGQWDRLASVDLPRFMKDRPVAVVVHGEDAVQLTIGGYMHKDAALATRADAAEGVWWLDPSGPDDAGRWLMGATVPW